MVSVSRSCQAVCQSDRISVHSYPQRTSVLVARYPHSYLVCSTLFPLIWLFWFSVKRHFTEILPYIFLVVNSVEHCFVFSLAICISSFVSCLIKSFDFSFMLCVSY